MSRRFLFVVPPFAGHVLPTVAIARALEARGHRVAWTGHPSRVLPLLPPGATLLALDERGSDSTVASILERSKEVRGLESLQFLWQDVLVPLARAMVPQVGEAISRFAPDVVVVDHQAVGGALAARRAGSTWATLCTTSASVVDPLTVLPRVKAWIDDQLASLESFAGLPRAPEPDISRGLVLVCSTRALIGAERTWPSHYRFVGPTIQDRPDATPFPWDALATLPRVFVSLGTVSAGAGQRFYGALVEGLRDVPLQLVFAAPPSLVGDCPPSWIVQDRVPQLAVLPKMSAVICHAGHNTTCEALANGLPLVVSPIRDDQPVIAQQVVAAGAGLRVKFGRASPATLRDAVMRVLSESSFREASLRIRDSFAAAGGAAAGADALETLT